MSWRYIVSWECENVMACSLMLIFCRDDVFISKAAKSLIYSWNRTASNLFRNYIITLYHVLWALFPLSRLLIFLFQNSENAGSLHITCCILQQVVATSLYAQGWCHRKMSVHKSPRTPLQGGIHINLRKVKRINLSRSILDISEIFIAANVRTKWKKPRHMQYILEFIICVSSFRQNLIIFILWKREKSGGQTKTISWCVCFLHGS
jgi:hypothetical protein